MTTDQHTPNNMEATVNTTPKPMASTAGSIVRGLYRRNGPQWVRVASAGRRWKGGELLPERIEIQQAVVYPIDDERYPASITLGSLPWECAGGHFRHLLCGPTRPALGTLLMHRNGPDEREVMLISRASLVKNDTRTMARYTASMVTGDPDVEHRMLLDVSGEQFDWLPTSEDLPRLHANME